MSRRRIDMHAHVIPPRYLASITGPDGAAPPLAPATRQGLESMMAAYEIDAAVISTGPPGAVGASQSQANEVARTANEEIAEIVHDAPSRFGGLALLPLPDVEAALAELSYALDDLKLDGVALFSNVGGAYLGDPAWEPLLAELDRRAAYVFVHPGFPPGRPPLIADHPVWLYEFPFETTRAVANLIYTGALERHRRIRFQLAHLGGAVPFLAHRLASLAEREPERATAAPAGTLAYVRTLYYDTGLTNNEPALAATRAVAGLERVVFGTDWPYVALPPGADPAPDLEVLGADARSAIDAINAAHLVPRLAAG